MKWSLVSWCLGLLILSACSRGDDGAQEAQTPEPTAFVATATVPGITGPPQTPQASEPPQPRVRAEAFLRRIAPTDADLPPGFGKPTTDFRDAAQLAAAQDDPAAAKSQFDRAELVAAYESTFANDANGSASANGVVRGVAHIGYAFNSVNGADGYFDVLAAEAEAAARALLAGATGDIQTGMAADLSLGEESVAWRSSGPSETVGWVIAVRRGAGGFLLTLHGSSQAVDQLARDLALRLDQRLAAAIPSAWP